MGVRKNVIIGDSVNDRLISESKRLGVSQSNLISIALDFYFKAMFEKEDGALQASREKGFKGSPLTSSLE